MAGILSLSPVRQGTDPPATDVVPDINLTTLGVLDWFLLGESAAGDQNFKASASYITSIVEIGSPSPTRYAGSNNKQASLVAYTDGTSPSSGGNRAWVGTNVTSAGWRITIALGGQSVRVKLRTGGYDGTHRIACSLSDSSASAVSSDQVTGSTAVGWWATDILAYAEAGAANLVIDVTRISGGVGSNSCQLQCGTVSYGTPVIKSLDLDTFHEGGGSSVVQIAGFSAAPDTATLDGVSLSVASATLTTATLTMPAESAFRFGGAFGAVPWLINKSLVLTKASESATLTTAQVQPPYSDQFGLRSADAASNVLDTYDTDKDVALGDQVYMWTDPVEVATIDASVVDYSPYTGDPITIYGKFFDFDEGTWSSRTTWTFSEDGLSLTADDLTVTPGQVVELTIAGGPFTNTITHAKAVQGPLSVDLAFEIISSTQVDVTMMDVDTFTTNNVGEYFDWYKDFVFRLEARIGGGETPVEVAETATPSQMIEPTGSDYGTLAAPPWGATVPSGSQESDKGCMVVRAGAGTAAVETLDFTPTVTKTLMWTLVYSMAQQKWLTRRETSYLVGKAMKSSRRDTLRVYSMSAGLKQFVVKGYVMQDGVRKEIF